MGEETDLNLFAMHAFRGRRKPPGLRTRLTPRKTRPRTGPRKKRTRRRR